MVHNSMSVPSTCRAFRAPWHQLCSTSLLSLLSAERRTAVMTLKGADSASRSHRCALLLGNATPERWCLGDGAA
jgi:hypothetical protein